MYIYTQVCVFWSVALHAFYIQLQTYTHKHIYTCGWEAVHVSTQSQARHVAGKRQHCEILVRVFFTHHWLHLCPSLDLDYVTARKVKEGQCVKIQRDVKMLDNSLLHTFSWKQTNKTFHVLKLLTENGPQLLPFKNLASWRFWSY